MSGHEVAERSLERMIGRLLDAATNVTVTIRGADDEWLPPDDEHAIPADARYVTATADLAEVRYGWSLWVSRMVIEDLGALGAVAVLLATELAGVAGQAVS